MEHLLPSCGDSLSSKLKKEPQNKNQMLVWHVTACCHTSSDTYECFTVFSLQMADLLKINHKVMYGKKHILINTNSSHNNKKLLLE